MERFYDAANRLIAEKSGAFVVQYRYDKTGRRTRRTTSHGHTVKYRYDAAGAVEAIRINHHDPVLIQRDRLGRITGEQLSPHLNRSLGYNPDGLLTHQRIHSAAGHMERRYEYDPAGRLIAKTDSHKGPWQFTYDPMGRITQALDPERQLHRFGYDPTGDLLDHLPHTGKDLRSARHDNTLYHYDAAGNLVEHQNGHDLTRFHWDEQNRLKTARKTDDTRITMTYDALGRRHIKAVNGERTFFKWDGDALLSEQFEDGPVREYVYYPGTFEPLAVIDGDGQVYYYQNDLNGLPQELTKPSGDIVWSATYDAMGRVVQILVYEVDQPLRFQGQYWDDEIGLCYNRYRYFDPQICSFISQDSLGLAVGENVYAYAPNVWGWVDPLGLACKQALPKFTDYQDFNSVFRFKPRRYGRRMWKEYLNSPEKFAGRQRVQDRLKAEGYWGYTPADRAEQAVFKANEAVMWTHGESPAAKTVQFTTELVKGIFTPQGTPQIYDTPAGNLGATIGSAIGNFFG